MAIQIRMTPPTLPNDDERVISTRIQVSSDNEFTNILADVTTTIAAEFYNVSINYETVVGKTYYARGMYITDKAGAEGWGASVEFISRNSVENVIDMRLPETAYPPALSIPLFGTTETPNTGFSIKLDFVESIAADVRSIDFLIEDIHGNVIVSQLGMDRGFKNLVVDKWLLPDTFYIARVMIHLDTGSKSLFAGLPFTTAKVYNIFRIIDTVIATPDSVISTTQTADMQTFKIELFDYESSIHTATATDVTIFTFNEVLTNAFKIGRVKTIYTDGRDSGWRYFYKPEIPCTLPLPLPAKLAC